MKELFTKIFTFLVNLYSFFYISLFITDYAFILREGLSNISGLTVLFLSLLLIRLRLERETFRQLFIARLLKNLSNLSDKALLAIIFTLIVFSISCQGIARHLSLSTMAWDMGIFDQALWNTLHGDILFSSIRGNFSLLGDHFEPILLLLVPFYALWPHVFNLIIIQALLLAVSIFPLYLIAKEKLNSRFLTFSLIVSFALSKGLRGVGLSDFHPEGFMVPLSFSAFYFLIKKKKMLFFLTTLLLLSCKETAVFIIIGLGLYALFFLKRRLTGLTLAAGGMLAWIIETGFVIPSFNSSGRFLFSVRMPFGNTYKENLRFVLNNPFQFLVFIFMPQKIIYCIKLLGQAAFLSAFSPSHYVLIALPLLTILLGSVAHSGYHLLSSHYVGQVLAFVYISAIYGLANLIKLNKLQTKKVSFFLGFYIIFISLIFYGKTDAYKFRKFIDGIRINRSFEKLAYLSLIPKDASLAATSNFVPHLSHRKYVYDWNPETAVSLITEYLVIDLDFLGYLPQSAKDKIPAFFLEAKKRGYKKIFSNRKESFFIFFNPNNNKSSVKNFRGNLGI